MNEEMRDMVEELGELKHKIEKMEHKLQQKLGQRGGYRGGRMGQNTGNYGGQNMGQSGGVFWGGMPQSPTNGMGGQYPMEDYWFDPRYM